MPLDFALLSMTELRNRPGEILDRVADRGEAFIIERSGQRKACLVPLSVLLPDISPARIADEIEQLVRQGEQPSASFTDGRNSRSVSRRSWTMERPPSFRSCCLMGIRITAHGSTPAQSAKKHRIDGRTGRFASME